MGKYYGEKSNLSKACKEINDKIKSSIASNSYRPLAHLNKDNDTLKVLTDEIPTHNLELFSKIISKYSLSAEPV